MQAPIGKLPPNRFALIAAILIIGTVGLFWPVGTFDFVGYDDPAYITQNPHVQAGLTKESIAWAFSWLGSSATYWHPLSWLSHMVDCQLFGLKPGAHHWTSVFFHVLNSILLFLLINKLTGAVWRSAAVAAIFAWHPLQVESVAWVTERKNLLSTMFLFLTLLAYLRYSRSVQCSSPTEPKAEEACVTTKDCVFTTVGKRLRRPEYILVFVLFMLGLMSKPMLVTVPCVLLLLDFWPLRRVESEGATPKAWLPLLLEKAPLFALSAISSWITIVAHQKLEMMSTTIPFSIRMANAALSYVRYVEKMFWPVDLAAIYPYPASWPVLQFVIMLLVLVVLTVVAWALRKNHTYLLFGWLWFLGTLVPVIGIVQAGSQSMADRFIYVPMIGLLIALSWGAAELFRKLNQQKLAPALATAVVLLACIGMARYQLQFWRDSMTLFHRCIAVTRNNAVAHYNLGYAYALKNDGAKAKQHYTEALTISPKYVDARNNLAGALFAEGRLNDAAVEYKKVLESAPNHPLAHFNLGIVLERQNHLPEALIHYEVVANTQPQNIDAHLKVTETLGRMGKPEQAFERVETMLRLNAKSAEAHLKAGKVYFAQQNLPMAQQRFETAVELNPNHIEARYELGNILGMQGKISDAMPHFAKVVDAKPDFAQAQFAFGATLASQGKEDQAVEHYRKAVLSDPQYIPALFSLSWLLSTHRDAKLRNGKEALQLAQRAVEITEGKNAAMLDLLGAAHAESGNFSEAITATEKALKLAEDALEFKQLPDLRNRLQLYQQKRSYQALN
jgi:tetratricopeptide (TPR) repeat protein